MNVERGLRRLLIVTTGLLVIVGVGLGIALSNAPVSCTYLVILGDGTTTGISAPRGATMGQVRIEGRRLHPETKNPVLTSKDGMTPPPGYNGPAVPESCAERGEATFARLIRYAREGAIGAALTLVLSAALWAVFFLLRWVARGFKSAT
jgi:hypothetical protein